VLRRDDLATVLEELRGSGRRLLGLSADGERTLADAARELAGSDLALIVGSEPSGIAASGRADLDMMVRIPMRGGVESLNVAAAGAIALFALVGG
jgi:23S rRNA (guanosine2251-2'-O)-methyltransferase